MERERRELEEHLQERLTHYYPGFDGETCEIKLVRSHTAAYSRLYIFHASNASERRLAKLAVKVFLGSTDQLDVARRQFESLMSLWPFFRDSQCYRIPRPLDFLPDIPAVVMEEVHGRSVQEILRCTRWRWAALNKAVLACQRCGQWLRYFHTATRIQPGRLDVCEKYQNIQAGLGQLAEYGFSEPLCKELQAKVESQVGLLSEHFDERALVHGDFTVDNVLVDEKKVTVLDIDGRYQNLIYHDVGSFLNSIGLATLGFPVRESTIRACNRAFLSGYFEYREYNYNTLWLLRASGLIAVTLEVLRRHLHQPPVKLWLSIYFARKFRRLVSEAPVS